MMVALSPSCRRLALLCACWGVVSGSIIALPHGFEPEGLVKGFGNTFYVATVVSNSIYAFDSSTREGSIVVPANIAGTGGLGLRFDHRTRYLYACGSFEGVLRVYDMANGASLVQTIRLTNSSSTLINDAVLTDYALYVTNSFASEFYKVELSADGSGSLPNPAKVTTVPLIGFQSVNGNLNLNNLNGVDINSNGIETPDGGKTLLIVNTASGILYKVDPASGVSSAVSLDEPVLNGDGMLFVKGLLYVALNRKTSIIKVLQLSSDYTSGKTLCNITNSEFDSTASIAYNNATNELFLTNLAIFTPYSVNNNYSVVEIDLDKECKCLWDTGCRSCSAGLTCHNYGYWSQCVEDAYGRGCVITNDWGCESARCCNPSATCTASGKCFLPCQYARGYRRT